jgi:hypothetical protein
MPVKVYDGTNWVTVAGDGQQGPAATSSSISTWVKTAAGGETSVSGTGDTGYGTLAYTVGQELVYLNGVLLDRGDDYTATNGTSIAGLTALAANDVITVWTVNSFSVANTYTIAQADAAFAPNTNGLVAITPTSISVGSGTASSSGKGQVTFTTVGTNLSLNGVFSSTYTNYLVVFSSTQSTTGTMSVRFRASGSDTSTNYYYNIVDYYSNSATVDLGQGNGTSSILLYDNSVIETGFNLNILNPNASRKTLLSGQYENWQSTPRQQVGLSFGTQSDTTAFDGITFLPSAGTMTGTVSVYGLAK